MKNNWIENLEKKLLEKHWIVLITIEIKKGKNESIFEDIT